MTTTVQLRQSTGAATMPRRSAQTLCECQQAVATRTIGFWQFRSTGEILQGFLNVCDACAQTMLAEDPGTFIVG